ncbi:MAG: MFS transporter [Alphaproteobacteria bacterium]
MAAEFVFDSRQSWLRLLAALALSSIGGIGLWSVVVSLPAIEAEFGVSRGSASLPYFATMVGFGIGGVFMGRMADRFGAAVPIALAGVMMCVGYIAASQATALWQFIAAQAILIGGLGASATFGPLVADISLWFQRRRGIAVAIVASGNYVAGTIWPPLLTQAIETFGWRQAHIGIGIAAMCAMVPLAMLLRQRAPLDDDVRLTGAGTLPTVPRLSPGALQALLVLAGLACCLAMSMPQVHIVAYCGDLGYGVASGAQMLSLMLGFGVVSRLLSGLIADKIGGVGTLIVGSTLQCLALLLYLPFDGLASLYIVSALFGLSQGGIVPSYAMIVREYFPAREAGQRVSLVMMATVFGMALGGWASGAIYDLTGSYSAAFLHGIGWNLLNMAIAFWLLSARRRPRVAVA